MTAEHDLHRRWNRRSRDPSFFALLLVGAALLVCSLVPAARSYLSGDMGLRLVQFLVGFCLIYLAILVHDVRGLRQRNLVLMETMLAAFRDNTVARKDAEAVVILLAALRASVEPTRAMARRQLMRLTGEDHGEDADAWDRWWAENQAHWSGRVGDRELP